MASETYDAVIIGAGAMGLCTAYYLAESGVKKIAVLEKEKLPGMEASGLNAGGIRTQFFHKTNLEFSLFTLDIYYNFHELFNQEIDYREYGYLFLISNETELEVYRESVELQNSCGVPAEIIGTEKIKEIVPQVNLNDVICGSLSRKSGYADPHSVCMGYVKGAAGKGVKILLNTEVTGIEMYNGNITGVKTANGSFSTGIVINAAGAHAGNIGRMAGIDIPIEPVRRHVYVTHPVPEIPVECPLVYHNTSGFYFRKELESVLMERTDPNETPGFKLDVNPQHTEDVVEHAMKRLPILENTGILRAWTGHYALTPDHQAIIGELPEPQGFYCLSGFSGHGMQHAPAAAKALSELIIDGTCSTFNIDSFSYLRFVDKNRRGEFDRYLDYI